MPTRHADLERIAPGQSATIRERMSAARVEAFAQLTGDDNPIHLSASAARQVGETRPIAHGGLLIGMRRARATQDRERHRDGKTRLPHHASV